MNYFGFGQLTFCSRQLFIFLTLLDSLSLFVVMTYIFQIIMKILLHQNFKMELVYQMYLHHGLESWFFRERLKNLGFTTHGQNSLLLG